jgi:hypothetical protein
MNHLELLNDDRCILRAEKRADLCYGIYNEKNCIGVLTSEELQEFFHGKTIILDGSGNTWNYLEYPDSMKPSSDKILEFIQ